MKDVTMNLRGIQAILLSLFTERTILIGHSLESDLIALKVRHIKRPILIGHSLESDLISLKAGLVISTLSFLNSNLGLQLISVNQDDLKQCF